MTLMLRITMAVLGTMVALLTFILSATLLVWVSFQILPGNLGEEITRKALTPLGLSYYSNRRYVPSDGDAASSDQRKIASRIVSCFNLTAESSLGEEDRSLLLLPPRIQGNADESVAAMDLGPSTKRLMLVSDDITRKRYDFQAESDENYRFMQYSTFFTIVIGLLTTVFVSISSSKMFEEGSRTAVFVKILAILFPALGTAFAAIIAFYNPNDKYLRAKQALVNLGQMQREIVGEIHKTDCLNRLDEAAQKQFIAKLDGWELQYGNLLNSVATRDLGQQGSSSGTAGGTGRGQGG